MNEEIQTPPKAENTPTKVRPAAKQTKAPSGIATPAQVSTVRAKKTPAPRAKTAKAPAAAAAAKAADKPPVPVEKPEMTEAPTTAESTTRAKAKKHEPTKPKLVRDSFTLPENDYALFATLKQRALTGGAEVKKSELVRAGLAMLVRADDAEFLKAIGLVERIKTGRPRK